MTIRDVETFADFGQYYSHRFFKSRSNPDLIYYLHGRLGADTGTVNTYLKGKPHGEHVQMTSRALMDDAVYGLPHIGMVAYNNELVYMFYRPIRNGSRGFGGDRVRFHSFNAWNLMNAGMRYLDRGDVSAPPLVHLVLNPVHVKYADAFERLSADVPSHLAYALSYKFGIHLTDKEYPILCYKTREIGEAVSASKVRLYKTYTEYADLIRRVLNPQMEIELV